MKTPHKALPREAREGLERAWLAVLRERHPEFDWRIVPKPETVDRERAHLHDD